MSGPVYRLRSLQSMNHTRIDPHFVRLKLPRFLSLAGFKATRSERSDVSSLRCKDKVKEDLVEYLANTPNFKVP